MRGLYLFVVQGLAAYRMQIMLLSHALFYDKSGRGRRILETTKMYLTQKNIKNLDIIGAFMRCPFDEIVDDCPFIRFHRMNYSEKQIEAFQLLSEKEIQSLKIAHQNCMAKRIDEMKE